MPVVVSNGLNIFYREAGQGPPVLLIQGFEMDHRGWARQVPALRERFRCISIDNRDVGQSDKVSGPYTTLDMARDALGVLDALGVERASVVGHSMGGAIAQEMAINFPERVDRLVLISTYVRMGERDRAIAEARKLLRARFSLEEYYRAVFPWVYADKDYAVPGQVEEIVRLAGSNPNPQPFDAFCRQSDAVMAHDTTGRLDRIRAPTLIIAGEKDLLTPVEQSYLLHQGIPGSRLAVIPGAGHGLLWTQDAQEVNRLLLSFLSGE